MSGVSQDLANVLGSRYAIEREIGRGGMGTVYLANDAKHGRKVAIKILDEHFSAAIGRVRFQREIEIAAQLAHPHIVPLYDSDEVEGRLYYVMPYVAGESLRELLDRERQLPSERAVQIAWEIADALAYAHAHKVIHRDIKPGNVLLESGHARVTDFGLATFGDVVHSDRLTASGISLGTPLYMSPEQALAQHIDARSDIYSLGCVLYEMLGGEPPFLGSTPQAVLAKKMYEEVPRITVLRDTVCRPLEQVVCRALARNPADRYDNAADLARELQAAGVAQQRSVETGLGAAVSDPGFQLRTQSTTSYAAPASRLSDILAAIAMAVVVLSFAGFISTTVYDVRMQLPTEFTPSRWDFPMVGARALVPLLVFGLAMLIGLFVLKNVFRVALFGLRKAPGLRDSLNSITGAAHRRTRNLLSADAIAELFMVGAIVVSIAVVAQYSGLFRALAGEGTDVLSKACRSYHNHYTFTLTALIVVLALLRRTALAALDDRRARAGSVLLVRWGGGIWILLLVAALAAPWRVLWQNDHPRVTLNGEAGYILMEHGRDLVIYNATRQVTQHYQTGAPAGFERFNSIGYAFEAPRRCK